MSTDAGTKPAAPAIAQPATSFPPQTIIVQQPRGGCGRFVMWIITLLLVLSVLAHFGLLPGSLSSGGTAGPHEVFHSGDQTSADKLAIIRVAGTIMPPFSDRVIRTIKKAKEDKHVKGVLLVIDSPGGTVTDSHQIYHRLKELSAAKPVVVSMGSFAASGGYFVAMDAEPTTWTGSIGVIIPHYEVTELAEKLGVKHAPLKTGEFKDSLSMFREMTPRDKQIWDNILKQAFELFLDVIDENRDTLDIKRVRELATGEIYTANDARQHGLIDEIGFQDDALDKLMKITNLTPQSAQVIKYEYPIDLWDTLLGSVKASDPAAQWQALLELSVPRAMYFLSGF
jgi:protease-4